MSTNLPGQLSQFLRWAKEQAMSDIKSMICHHKQDRECQKGVKMKQGVANSLLFCLEGLMVAKEIRNKKLGRPVVPDKIAQ